MILRRPYGMFGAEYHDAESRCSVPCIVGGAGCAFRVSNRRAAGTPGTKITVDQWLNGSCSAPGRYLAPLCR